MDDRSIIGRWQIVAWEQIYDDGRRTYPMGEQVEGFIQYDFDGHMMCMLCRGDRQNFTKGGQWNASVQEKADAYGSMMAYAGTYTCMDNTVSHHVQLSAFPNWKGGIQKRGIEKMDDVQLVLIARLEEKTSEARMARLIWKREN